MKNLFVGYFLILSLLALPLQAESGSTEKLPLRVMTFNIRFGTANDGPNSWEHRRSQLLDVIRDFSPTILGTQEGLRFQLDELLEEFPNLSLAGIGRDDGISAGEFSAILYDRNRLQLLEHGTFWFSETPQQPGSTAWGAQIPRICSWIRCRDQTSGKDFYTYNVHWDHMSQESREQSAKLLIKRIASRREQESSVIVTGDFNSGEQSPQFLHLLAGDNPKLRDSYRQLYPHKQQTGTFNSFRGTTKGEKIDAVLVSSDWTVSEAEIIHANKQGHYPSDHFPVTALLQ